MTGNGAQRRALAVPLRDMPAAEHSAGVGDDVRAADLSIIPNRDRAVVIAPENVVLAVDVAGAGDVIRPVSNEVKVREMLEQLFGSVLDRNRLICRNGDDRIAIGIVGGVGKYVRQARK
jgi:hypothetical protein